MRKRIIHRISNYEKAEHDQVVAARAKQLSLFYKVLADSDMVKSTYKSNNLYPDIIVMDEKNNILFIEEIVTKSSVTRNERDKLWMRYSELGYPFNLIVPRAQELKAKRLIKGLNFHKLYYYNVTTIGVKFRQVS